MCQASDPVIQQLVEDVVRDKTDKGELFTAFDVTRAIRSDGTRARHGDVKVAVHGLFSDGEMGNYQRSLASLQGVSPQPFLYHPVGADVSSYDPGASAPQGKTSPTPATTPTSTPSDPADDDDDDGIVRKTGQEGSLYIPTTMVRDIQLKQGEKSFIYQDNNTLVVSAKDDDSLGTLLATPVVDVKGNVRINKGKLPDKTTYRIKVDEDKILIS